MFHKAGSTASACSADPSVMVTISASANGAFTAQIPMDPSRCPRSLFDGSTVTYDVLQAGESSPIATRVPITPVPYARFADQVGVNNDCPAGYSRADAAGVRVLCLRGDDQVVRVGTGASAFWIDRYEASVWSMRDARGAPYFRSDGDFPVTAFPRNGQWTTPEPPAYAASAAGVPPARWITWFQAFEACRASGKRLPTGEEWLAAGRGTTDPGVSDGSGGSCNTMGGAPRAMGTGTACISAWGVQDAIGNLWEWTVEWYAGAGTTTFVNVPVQNWPADYRSDGTWNVNGHVYRAPPSTETVDGIPSAALRGGSFSDGIRAGVFSLLLDSAPSQLAAGVGFRCVIPR